MVTFGHSKVWLVVIVMATMWSATARGYEYNCTVPNGGNCTFDSAGCRDQMYSPEDCFPSLPNSISNLTATSQCIKDFKGPANSSIPRPTHLNLTVEPNNLDTYLLKISWTPVLPIIPSYLLGYYILVTEDGDSLPHGCVKLTSSTASSVVFVMEYYVDQIDVVVRTIPNYQYNELSRTISQPPRHCHDFPLVNDSIIYSRCGPPTPMPPSVKAEYCSLPDDLMSVTLTWDPPTTVSGYSCCSHYWILVKTNISEFVTKVRVEGTSLTLQPLTTRLTYYIFLQLVTPCAFDKHGGIENCGLPSRINSGTISHCDKTSSPASVNTSTSIIPPTSVLPLTGSSPTVLPPFTGSSPTVLPSFTGSSPTFSDTLPTTPSPIPTDTPLIAPSIKNPIYFILAPIILVVILFGLALVVLCVVYRFSHRHRYLPSIVRDPCELAHLEPGYSLPPSPSPSPLSPPSPLPPLSATAAHQVVVVFSEKIPEVIKQRIHVCLVCELNQYAGISVTYYEIAHRRATSSWIEEMVGKASVVLAVCDKWFKEEWLHGGGASVVHALHQTVLAETTNGQQLDSKYAVVLMHEDNAQYIPGLLGNTVRFNIMEAVKMVQYIQQSHQYSNS